MCDIIANHIMNTKLICCLLATIFLSCQYGRCTTIYIKPYESTSCGFGELTGDPCVIWTGYSPTIDSTAPSTTLVFTPGTYGIQIPIHVSVMSNFTMIGDPGAHIVCQIVCQSDNIRAFTLDTIGPYVKLFVLMNCSFSYNHVFFTEKCSRVGLLNCKSCGHFI